MATLFSTSTWNLSLIILESCKWTNNFFFFFFFFFNVDLHFKRPQSFLCHWRHRCHNLRTATVNIMWSLRSVRLKLQAHVLQQQTRAFASTSLLLQPHKREADTFCSDTFQICSDKSASCFFVVVFCTDKYWTDFESVSLEVAFACAKLLRVLQLQIKKKKKNRWFCRCKPAPRQFLQVQRSDWHCNRPCMQNLALQ